MTTPRTVTAATVLAGDRELRPGWLSVHDGRVVDLGQGQPPADSERRDLGAVTVVPGFVDMHVHGGGGASFGDGVEAARTAAATHLAHGTTSLVASLVSERPERLLAQVEELRALVAADDLLGVHLEGPWLSEHHPGVHEPALLHDPEPGEVDRLLAAGDGAVRMVTLAPERTGGLDAVRRIVAAGAVAAIGHSDATYDVARAALDAGARVGTHLFNASRPLGHREPGLVLALLESRATIELIADGRHVHDAVLRRVAGQVGPRLALVTDAMAAAGGADGDYHLGPARVAVRDGSARVLDDRGRPGRLAGSLLTLDAAVAHAVRRLGLTLAEAVHAASTAPADALGRGDLGRLAPGARADLVALDADLAVAAVMRRGRWVGRAPGVSPPAR